MTVWKKVAILILLGLLPVSAVAHTKLFYKESYRSDYRKVEIVEPMVTPEPTVTPLVEIPLEPTLALKPTLTPTPTLAPIEVPTEAPTPTVEIIDTEEISDQITTPSDIAITPKCPPTVLRQWMS